MGKIYGVEKDPVTNEYVYKVYSTKPRPYKYFDEKEGIDVIEVFKAIKAFFFPKGKTETVSQGFDYSQFHSMLPPRFRNTWSPETLKEVKGCISGLDFPTYYGIKMERTNFIPMDVKVIGRIRIPSFHESPEWEILKRMKAFSHGLDPWIAKSKVSLPWDPSLHQTMQNFKLVGLDVVWKSHIAEVIQTSITLGVDLKTAAPVIGVSLVIDELHPGACWESIKGGAKIVYSWIKSGWEYWNDLMSRENPKPKSWGQ